MSEFVFSVKNIRLFFVTFFQTFVIQEIIKSLQIVFKSTKHVRILVIMFISESCLIYYSLENLREKESNRMLHFKDLAQNISIIF